MRKKPQAEVGKVEQALDGKAHRYHMREDGTAVTYTMCCDCSLVHLEEFKPMGKYIRVRVWREEEMTQKFRRRRKKKIRV